MSVRSALLWIALLLLLAPSVRADAPVLQASLRCDRAAGPGRILCELTTWASSGTLVWSDALVVRAPAFARPLRSRFVAQLGTAAGPGVAWAKLALVASQAGQGRLELLARGAVCHSDASGESCLPEVVPVLTQVDVGEPSSAAPRSAAP